jgi:hypothetical protein
MKFKYLSSDFLASYDEIIEALESRQAELDSLYSEKISSLLAREKVRLNQLAPKKFDVGDLVKITGTERTGVIVDTSIDFDLEISELDELGRPYYGPGRYLTIRSNREEEIATCEGNFRSYSVESKPHVIAQDWGVVSVTETFYEEDLEKV